MERLREHFHRHNRRVLALTLVTFLLAAGLWAALYFVMWWLVVLGGVTVNPFDFHPPTGPLARGFIATAVVLCLFAWLTRRLRPNEVPVDHKGIGGNMLDVLLAIPRLTLAIFGAGAATARLNSHELEYAWDLLGRMNEAGGRLAMQTLPVEIPDRRMRRRILLALQLSGIIEICPTSNGPVLAFRNEEARRLAQERVRLRL